MKIEYIGPKAVISERGISFKDGKDDKFVYINNAIQIFLAINHDYQKSKLYTHLIEDKNYTSDEVFQGLKNNIEDFEERIQDEINEYEKLLNEQEEEVETLTYLLADEKYAFVNNLKIMREYRTQRFINKIVYEHIIKAITQTIVEHQLHEIQTPFNERFWHTLQTIQGWLSKHERINSTLNTITDDDGMSIKLHINKIY